MFLSIFCVFTCKCEKWMISVRLVWQTKSEPWLKASRPWKSCGTGTFPCRTPGMCQQACGSACGSSREVRTQTRVMAVIVSFSILHFENMLIHVNYWLGNVQIESVLWLKNSYQETERESHFRLNNKWAWTHSANWKDDQRCGTWVRTNNHT